MRVLLGLLVTVSIASAGVDKLAVRKVIKQHVRALADCFEAENKRSERVMVDFVIAKSGAVKSAVARSTGRPTLEACVVGIFARMKFPASREETSVSYPVGFIFAGQ